MNKLKTRICDKCHSKVSTSILKCSECGLIFTHHLHINEPTPNSFQVRIVRNGEESSRLYSHGLWGGRIKALESAIKWRDQMRAALEHTVLTGATARNLSTGVLGVSKCIDHDKRDDTYRLVYQATYAGFGYKYKKKFDVGNVDEITADEELHALNTAVSFRADCEYFSEKGMKFNTHEYGNWRDKKQ